jgi:CBS domain-containing protein
MSLVVSLVKEHMTPSVVSVKEATSLEDVLRALRKNDVSCVLVTSDDGAPRGVVSMSDLARASKLDEGKRGDRLRILPPKLTARDVMKTELVTVDETADVGEAASKMLKHEIHRVFVRRGASIVGVFSTKDAMRVVVFRNVTTPLKALMTKEVATVGLGETIDDALAKLERSNLRGLVVVDGKAPVGLFTQMEAIRARARDPARRSRPVEELTSYEMITLDVDTPLHRAASHALATSARRILAVEGKALRGILTGYDVARALV